MSPRRNKWPQVTQTQTRHRRAVLNGAMRKRSRRSAEFCLFWRPARRCNKNKGQSGAGGAKREAQAACEKTKTSRIGLAGMSGSDACRCFAARRPNNTRKGCPEPMAA